MTPPAACRLRGQTGQAALLMLGVLAALLTGVLVLLRPSRRSSRTFRRSRVFKRS